MTQSLAAHAPVGRELGWRVGDVEGTSISEDVTRLRNLTSGAELTFARGRLSRGAGYADAPAVCRRDLARAGAILRLRQRNRYFVHASGVADRAGRATVFIGESGSGKSTIAFALARRGWLLLGDDGVVLEPHERTTTAHSWRAPLLVSSTLDRYFPELRDQKSRVLDSDARQRIPHASAMIPRAALAALVFVQQRPTGYFERLEQFEALSLLVRQSPWVLLNDSFAARHFEALRLIVTNTPVFAFAHGPAELANIETYFEDHASGFAGATI